MATTPPAPQTPYLEVARRDRTALVHVAGLGNMHLAPTLQAYVDEGIADGCVQLALDLADCTGLDSTFMGTMVGLSASLKEHGGWMCVMNVGPDNERLLRTLGVWEFVSVIHRPRAENIPLARLVPSFDPAQRLAQIHQSHKNLVNVDEKNRARFGQFLEVVENEMAVLAKAQADDVLTVDGLEEIPPAAAPAAPLPGAATPPHAPAPPRPGAPPPPQKP